MAAVYVSLHLQGQEARRTAARSFTTCIHSASLDAHKKLGVLEAAWSDLLAEVVGRTLREYSQLETTMTHMLDNL